MEVLAETTTLGPNAGFLAITIAVVVALALQLWALIETAIRRRWVWLVATWVTFPLGAIAWITYGRRHANSDVG